MDVSRRSACDRCRNQKLRCVRPSKPGNGILWGDEPLESCERCRKVGTDCVNTHSPPRKAIRVENLSHPTGTFSVPSSQRRRRTRSSHSYTPANTSPHPNTVRGNPECAITGDERIKQTSARVAETTFMHQARIFPEQLKENLLKQRSQESVFSQTETSSADQEQLEAYNAKRHVRDRSKGNTGVSNTLSIDRLDTPALTADKSPPPGLDQSFSVDTFDFTMGYSSDISAHPDNSANFLNDLFPSGQGTRAAPLSDLTTENVLQLTGNPGNQMTQIQEDCLTRLSDLSSGMLKDIRRTGSKRLSDILSSSPFLNARASNCSDQTRKSTHSKNTIGNILESSQTFLDILQNFNVNRSSSVDSLCSYSEYSDDDDFFATAKSRSDLSNDMVLASSDINHSSNAENTEGQKSPNPAVAVDMPTTLTILTCYTCLLQTYETIFSRILEALISHAETSLPPTLAILPGLYIGGFNLDSHTDLQVEVLIQISWRMLERIEKILGISVISQPLDLPKHSTTRGRGILDMASASAFLDALFKQKDLGFSKGVNWRATSVKQTMDKIRKILDGLDGNTSPSSTSVNQ